MTTRSGQSLVTSFLLLQSGISFRVKYLSSVREARYSQGAPGLRNSIPAWGDKSYHLICAKNRAHPFILTSLTGTQTQCYLEKNKLYRSHCISPRKNGKPKSCLIVILLNILLSGVVLSGEERLYMP